MTDFTRERITAIVRLLVMLASAVAGGFGLTVDPDALGTIAACAVALVAGIYGWWKNNNLTKAAQDAQAYLDAVKATYREAE
ncbi:phage holin [Collinsella intestinalis]|uniref:phage holin n=1 Tax=Collinsella intestinalis TaxID=147207 RepID=UPI0025A46ADA|nr:phage holin [Collinsella intestinalis]MDM8162402.1 phage holin [Collinsella intestinalis]